MRMKLATHPHLMPNLRSSGTIPPVSRMLYSMPRIFMSFHCVILCEQNVGKVKKPDYYAIMLL